MMCLRIVCGFALDLLAICGGCAPPAPAHAAQAQACAKDLLVMCLRFARGCAWESLVMCEGFDPLAPAQPVQAQA